MNEIKLGSEVKIKHTYDDPYYPNTYTILNYNDTRTNCIERRGIVIDILDLTNDPRYDELIYVILFPTEPWSSKTEQVTENKIQLTGKVYEALAKELKEFYGYDKYIR